MEDKNLVEEMVEELDETGKFFFWLLALLVIKTDFEEQ